ncbi:hypothetical protein ABFY81_04870 [Acinetobacter sp. WA-87]|uniref:hypothetical protein n=1 Tax=Acinetobacter sp. WA-87 TaxID=3153556 RepID=UPI003267E0DA
MNKNICIFFLINFIAMPIYAYDDLSSEQLAMCSDNAERIVRVCQDNGGGRGCGFDGTKTLNNCLRHEQKNNDQRRDKVKQNELSEPKEPTLNLSKEGGTGNSQQVGAR